MQASSDAGTEGEGDGEEDTQSMQDLVMHFDEEQVEQREDLEEARAEEAGDGHDAFRDAEYEESEEE